MDETSLETIYRANETVGLESLSKNIKAYLHTGDINAVHAIDAEFSRRPALIRRIFPGALEKKYKEFTIQTMQQRFEFHQIIREPLINCPFQGSRPPHPCF